MEQSSSRRPSLQNKVQLITYADSLGKNLNELHTALEQYFSDIVYGVHILPFYPSSSDRGFSPLTHVEVDPAFGTWEDIKRIGEKYDVMCDFIVNHRSSQSEWFQDFLEKGDNSEYKECFITEEKFGDVSEETLKKIDMPRPESPFVEFACSDGTIKKVWCTFSKDQIDLDTTSPKVKAYFNEVMEVFAQNGVDIIRLDAAGYAAKEPGTTCFLISPTYSLIEELGASAYKHGMAILPEMHNHYKLQLNLAKRKGVDYVYDFALSMLLMHALLNKETEYLKHWIDIRPEKSITTLDTHDGLPIPDIVDLLPEEEREKLAMQIKENGGEAVERASGANAENVDHYQINCTYYSALAENDDAYIAARAIQLFVPGIPQIYYVGLLVGKNDEELLEQTNNGRDINRHAYTLEEIEQECMRPVVQRLFKLIQLRNNHPAFSGRFYTKHTPNTELHLGWHHDDGHNAELHVDFETGRATATYSEEGEMKTIIL